MKRRHLFEFCDQPWLAGRWRLAYVDCLGVVLRLGRTYSTFHQPLAAWAQNCSAPAILELASGSGEATEELLRRAKNAGLNVPKIVMSDLYPNTPRYEELQKKFGRENIDYLTEPTAADCAGASPGLPRLICSAFHHFPPGVARRVLQAAAASGGGIFIVEPLERSIVSVLYVLLAGPFAGMLTPFLSRSGFSWFNLLVCTLFPIVPLMVQFDGMISALRCYRHEEIIELFPQEERSAFVFHYGRAPTILGQHAAYFYTYRRPQT